MEECLRGSSKTAGNVNVAAAAIGLVAVLSLGSCSLEKVAMKKVAGMLSGSSSTDVFSSDNDPDLVGDALPFAIKLYESLLSCCPTTPGSGSAPAASISCTPTPSSRRPPI